MATSIDTALELQLREQKIYHYSSINELTLNESNFQNEEDPIVIYRKESVEKPVVYEQVKVLPFKEEHLAKASLPFVEKLQYYRKSLITNVKELVENEDLTVVKERTTDYGELTDFISAYHSPVISGELVGFTTHSYFDSHFLDLQADELTLFQMAYENAKA